MGRVLDALAGVTVAATILLLGVRGAPSVSFPLNSQVPPVARVSEDFQYTLAKTTFTSTAARVEYSLNGAPPWLHINSDSRSLSGRPQSDDVGPQKVIITAKDESGTADMDATLIVSAEPPPRLGSSPGAQLAKFGSLSNESSLLLYPSSPFSFEFSRETFSGGGNPAYFYAISADHTPMPSWIFFDSQALKFYGTTPPLASLIEPPQTFDLKLICSDVAGFSAASADFSLVVGTHQLAFDSPVLSLNMAKGEPVDSTLLLDELKLDKAPVNIRDIASIDAHPPAWLSLDKSTLRLTGNPPDDALPQNFTVVARDVYKDVATTTVALQIPTILFRGPLKDIEARIGQSFQYALSRAALNDANIDAASNMSPVVSWIKFDSSKLEWSGHVPKDAQPSQILVKLTATSRKTRVSESQTFRLSLVRNAATTTTTSSARHGPSPTSDGVLQTRHHRQRKSKIALIVLAPIMAIFGAALLFFCWSRFRRPRPRPITQLIRGPLSDDFPLELRQARTRRNEPPPRLPRPARFSGIWRSYTDLHTGRGQMDASDLIPLGYLKPKHERSGPTASPRRPRRPDSYAWTDEDCFVSPSPTSQALGSLRIPSPAQGKPNAGRSLRQAPSSESGVLGKSSTRGTWVTIGSNESTEMSNESSDVPQPQAGPSIQQPSVRLVSHSPEGNSITATRAQRYGPRRDITSSLFGGGPRVPSRPHTWRKQKDGNPFELQSDECTIDSMLRSLTGHEAGSENGSPRSNGGSEGRTPPAGGKALSRSFGSRICENLGRQLGRPLSNPSLLFKSPSFSRDSLGRNYVNMDDEGQHRRWYNPSQRPEDAENMGLDERRSEEGPQPDADIDQHRVELGVASMAKRPSTPGSPGARGWPATRLSAPATPRLVEFKRRTAVSSGLERHRTLTVPSSVSASIASPDRSDAEPEPPASSQKAFI